MIPDKAFYVNPLNIKFNFFQLDEQESRHASKVLRLVKDVEILLLDGVGCAYLAKIRYGYFKSIKDSENAYLCTIAAYNTGAGNVAKALTNTTKLKPTAHVANKMSSKKLYDTLIKDLKYEETQNYLRKVWSRKDKYKKI